MEVCGLDPHGEVRAIEERATKTLGESVALSVRARTDVLVTNTRYQAVGDVPLPEDADSPPPREALSP